jgi:hypothetical protein
MELPDRPRWLAADRFDRLDRERADAFLAALDRLAKDFDYQITQGGVSLREEPGSGNPPEIEVSFIQLSARGR